jgi:hypothetical protein
VASNGNYTPKINFDGANGVGAEKMISLAKNLDGFLEVNILVHSYIKLRTYKFSLRKIKAVEFPIS